MNKKTKYLLSAVIGLGSLTAGTAIAAYNNYGTVETAPVPTLSAPSEVDQSFGQPAAYGPRGVVKKGAPRDYAAPQGYGAPQYVPQNYAAPQYTVQSYAEPVPAAYYTETQPYAEQTAPVAGSVAKDKDGSLFPGGDCPNCRKDKDGSLFGGGPCKTCSKDGSLFPGPCNKCKKRQEAVLAPVMMPTVKNYIPYTPVVYEAMQHDCCQMAPLALDHVDFRIKNKGIDGPYSSKLGNYRFRIFGCRRFNKEAHLNSGRIMEKNINFATVFEETVSDCYKVLPMPKDLCLQTVPTELPEYVLTAEITDYFMNVCDEYDWDNARKTNERNGTSEMTVVWRLMDLTKNTVYWKGESNGYGELYQGEVNGEVKLIERAFADAVTNLRALTGFEDQLMMRVDPTTLAAQRNALVEEERALNPIKCGYRKEYDCVKSCEVSRPGVDISQCQPMNCGCAMPCDTQPCGCTPTPVVEPQAVVEACIDANGQLREDGNCHVVDDTWIDTGDVKALDGLCIVTTDPCQALTPETVYRMRSSVVQIESPNGRKGAGLLISDRFVLTSGDLVDRQNNTYKIKTIRNDNLSAHAVRINPSKNTALMMLDQSVEYTPLALNLALPEVGRNGYLTLGLMDVPDFTKGENYLENSARIEGFRYTEEKGAEILANTFIQNVTVGGALFYQDCTVSGMAHSGVKTKDGLDAYIPTETALRSLGICICGHEYVEESPWQQTVYMPVTEQIKVVQEAPEVMKPKDRK